MATLDSLTSDVIELTKRPDLVELIRQRVKSRTLSVHQKDDFIPDLRKDIIIPSRQDNSFVVDLQTKFPLLRKVQVVNPIDSGIIQPKLTPIQSTELFGFSGVLQTNCWYVTGTELNVNTRLMYSQYLVHVFVYPNVSSDRYNSWIANQFPDAIVQSVASFIFKRAGKGEEAASAEALAKEAMGDVIRNNIYRDNS